MIVARSCRTLFWDAPNHPPETRRVYTRMFPFFKTGVRGATQRQFAVRTRRPPPNRMAQQHHRCTLSAPQIGLNQAPYCHHQSSRSPVTHSIYALTFTFTVHRQRGATQTHFFSPRPRPRQRHRGQERAVWGQSALHSYR